MDVVANVCELTTKYKQTNFTLELLWKHGEKPMGRSSDISGNSHKVVKENECEEEDFSRLAVKIKISPEEFFISSFLKLPGFLPIDVRASFKKLYPRSEVQKGSLLKFYLKMCDLGGKIDMPINRMRDYYKTAKENDFHRICKTYARGGRILYY